MGTWVDFKTVKQSVPIAAVLQRYGVKLKASGKHELRGPCPIHGGGEKDCFHANTEKNNFNCFAPSCQAHGNVLDFVAGMERCTVRDAALRLQDWFVVPTNGQPAGVGSSSPAQTPQVEQSRGVEEGAEINEPLRFQLRGIDHNHAYLAERGIARETAESFGVGFFPGKGSMAGRVVIPIHNKVGELVGYAGRAIDKTDPKYRLPAGFHKALELYSLHRAMQSGGANVAVVVEGFFDCMKVWQAGFPAVALMGCSLSAPQEELLVSHFSAAWLMLDGDEAGRAGTAACVERLVRRMFVRVVEVPDGKQPDMLEAGELQGLLGSR